MTWFKIDDSFYDHPKVFDAPDCAVALWTRAGTWSARNRTDGLVPAGMPARFCDDPDRAIKELVQRGLWSRTRGGFQFHDWHDYQPTREEAIAAATKMSSGGALGNHRRWHAGKGKTDPRCPFCQQQPDRGTHRLPDRPGDGTPESAPNPPVPARPVLIGGELYSATNGRAHARPEPPKRCPEHEDDPNPPPCRRCGTARAAHEQWQADERRRLADAPRCQKHRGQLAHNCGLCRAEQVGAE
jgi:hypothetical protein